MKQAMVKMDVGYFEEKQRSAFTMGEEALYHTRLAMNLIGNGTYESFGAIDDDTVHDTLRAAASEILACRRYFELALWASSDTKMEFEAWLRHRHLWELMEKPVPERKLKMEARRSGIPGRRGIGLVAESYSHPNGGTSSIQGEGPDLNKS